MEQRNGCIFCGIVSGRLPASIVYQDDRCAAFMDTSPINPGHLLVVPKRHVASLAELDEGTGAQVFRVAHRLAGALRRSGVKCEGVNFHLADDQAAGQEVFHTHLHVFPRYRGDGFGLRFAPTYPTRPDRAELDRVAQEIRDTL